MEPMPMPYAMESADEMPVLDEPAEEPEDEDEDLSINEDDEPKDEDEVKGE